MLNFVFWNTGGCANVELLAKLAQLNDADLLLLAENSIEPVILLQELNRSDTEYRFHPSPNERVQIFSRLPRRSIRIVRDVGGVAIRRISPPLGLDFLLTILHLPSKSHYDRDDHGMHSVRIAGYIREAESAAAHSRTVVVGDMNMNPFDPGVVGCDGFHAVMTRRIAAEEFRRVQHEDRAFLYNPMWRFFGDRPDHPAGSYFYRESTPIAYFWNVFDQVLVRPALLPAFRDDDVSLVTRIGHVALLSEDGTPNARIASDHLPLRFRLGVID